MEFTVGICLRIPTRNLTSNFQLLTSKIEAMRSSSPRPAKKAPFSKKCVGARAFCYTGRSGVKDVRIEGYRFGETVIDGKKYTSDVMIFPDRVTSWWRKQGHAVEIEDLNAAVDTAPEIVIIGTGAYGAVRVLPEVEKFLSSRGVKLIAAPTAEACDRYNRLCAKHRLVAAVHLTC